MAEKKKATKTEFNIRLVRNCQFLFQLLLLSILTYANCFAIAFKAPRSAGKDSVTPAILKADNVDGDKVTNIITATGHVEVTKDNTKLTSDIITYDKLNGFLKADGNVRVKDPDLGKMRASEAQIKSDFSSGFFLDSTLVFSDGSYLKSERADRKTPEITVFQRPIFSLCPSKEINKENDLAGQLYDTISIKSREATVDRENQTMQIKHGILRIYSVPVLYTPYIKFPLPDNKRKSGFLAPSYIKNNRFGLGFVAPYFLDIAPNADLTVTPKYYLSNGQTTVINDFQHLSKYGQYNTILEISNNNIVSNTDKLVIDRTKKKYRWLVNGNGKLDFTDKSSAAYNLNTAGDRNYLRDYNYSFLAYTVSDAQFDHTDGRDFYGVKTVQIQELVDVKNEKSAPLVLPTLNSYIESKPLAHNVKLALASNFSAITRESGLQYRRASLTPEIKVPLNLHGNLFNFGARVQGDIYSLENNFQYDDAATAATAAAAPKYDSVQTNYRPEISASWRLPLIQKKQSNTLLVEPIVNFVSSSTGTNYLKLPDEDSNNAELTVNNLFVNNRIAGYDRNEIGERVSYGVKTSTFNRFGQLGLTLGQSYRFTSKPQDTSIRGFNDNNKSNIVGEFSYKIPKHFNMIYSFQLNESNYQNDVNSVISDLTFDRFFIGGNYLLLKKNNNNPTKAEQGGGRFGFKLTPKLTLSFNAAHDFITKRTISRGVTVDYGGCCILVNFSVKENNSSNLIKPQKSFQINVLIRGF